MDNKIILYNNQKVDSLIYSSESFSSGETDSFKSENELQWSSFENAKIICNFTENLNSSLVNGIRSSITNYEISKKRPEDNFVTTVANLTLQELNELNIDTYEDKFYHITDYNICNNNEYTYFVSPMTEDFVQTTFSSKVLVQGDVFTLTPIYCFKEKTYRVIKDEFGQPINWVFQLNCSEGDITLNQDKTTFTTFAPKPKISVGDLNYHSGSLSCLLGNVLYNDQYYEPNILLEKWENMIKENHIYLFKNPKGDAMVVSLDDGIKRKYMNEVANYYIGEYNRNISITNRPTTIDFSYIEIMEAKDIQVIDGR